MQHRYSLISEPWIPVIGQGKISLTDLFTSPVYRIGGSAIEQISLFRFLIAIAHSAYFPKNEDDWLQLGINGLISKIRQYLDKHQHEFDLYGDHPFLQLPEVKCSTAKPLSSIFPEIASGNTTVLTQNQVSRIFTDAEIALNLLTLMSFALGGKKTDNSIVLSPGYLGKQNDKRKPSSGRPGKALDSFGLLHTFVLGENVWETLWLNLWTKESFKDEKIKTAFPDGLGQAAWEMMPQGEDCAIAKRLKRTLLGHLVPLSRFCLIQGQSIYLTEGIHFPDRKEGFIDLTASVILGKKNRVLWTDPNKRPWRELASILSANRSQPNLYNMQLSIFFNHLKNCRALNREKNLTLWSGGLCVSSNAGEQYISGTDDYVESSIELTYQEFTEELWYLAFCQEMSELEHVALTLRKSVDTYNNQMKLANTNTPLMAVNDFWIMAESLCQKIVNACAMEGDEGQKAICTLQKISRSLAVGIYSKFCPYSTAHQMQAWASCYPNFDSKQRK